MKIFFQAFFRDVNTKRAPLISLKHNGCYCDKAFCVLELAKLHRAAVSTIA